MAYTMRDDSVTVRGKGRPEWVGKNVTRRGEELRREDGPEPGRFDIEDSEPRGAPAGGSTARDVTSVRPLDPVSDKMPNLR